MCQIGIWNDKNPSREVILIARARAGSGARSFAPSVNLPLSDGGVNQANLAPELEGRCLQLAASRLSEGGRGRGILMPEVHADRRKKGSPP
jgi:hypothetical protein